MLGSPAENTLPPVSKPSAFGSPRRASIILQGLFKLVGKVLPVFFFLRTVGYMTFSRNSVHTKTDFIRFIDPNFKTIGAFLWQVFDMSHVVVLGGPHLQLICLWHKHGMMDAEMPARPAVFARLLALCK